MYHYPFPKYVVAYGYIDADSESCFGNTQQFSGGYLGIHQGIIIVMLQNCVIVFLVMMFLASLKLSSISSHREMFGMKQVHWLVVELFCRGEPGIVIHSSME